MKEEKYRDNRGNVVLLTVIAIVTMVIVLVGATFAYFASLNINVTNTTNVRTTTGDAINATLATIGDTITLSLSGSDMLPTAIDEDTPKATGTGDIVVQFTGGSVETPMQCKYDLYYAWVNVAADPENPSIVATTPYVRSDATKNEFTYTITKNNAAFVGPINFVASADANATTGIKIGGEQTITSNGTLSTDTYNITAAFYNIEADQTSNANANWKIKFYVVTDNSRCTAVE